MSSQVVHHKRLKPGTGANPVESTRDDDMPEEVLETMQAPVGDDNKEEELICCNQVPEVITIYTTIEIIMILYLSDCT